MTTLIDAPNDYPRWPDSLMSNFDHTVNQSVAERMRGGERIVADYPGWNFHAECWFANGLFHAAVRQYHVHVGTYSAETPESLMEEVSERFGND